MENIKNIIGRNLSELRKNKNLTQLELANKFNYSDKAISKWETGEALPDVETLYQLCEFYGVTMDYLTHEGSRKSKSDYVKDKTLNAKRITITALVITLLWMIATIIYVFALIKDPGTSPLLWLVFIWFVPGTFLAVIAFNKLWFHNRNVYFVFLSLFMWSLLAAFFLQFLEQAIWPIFLLGVPAQIAIVLWVKILNTKTN